MAKILNIIKYPDSFLRQKAKEFPVEQLRKKEIKELLEDMNKTMKELDGAGLAAPQIGQSLRIIVVNDEKTKKSLFMINPKITKKSWAQEIEDEGCLSVVDDKGEIIYGPVSRHKKVTCNYFDENGNKKKIQAEKILARIIQHEIDHLDGVLFIDRLVK